MLQFQIPTKNTKLFQQVNKGDVLGNLVATFGMDFDAVEGRARVSRRLRINADDTDDAQLGLPTAFARHGGGSGQGSATNRWWALCDTRLFYTAGTNPSAAFTEAVSDDGGTTSPPTTLTKESSDLVVFNEKLYVSDTTDINEYNNTVWDNAWWLTTLGKSALTSGILHPLAVTVKTNKLLIGDGNLIHTVDKNEKVSTSRVILPAEFRIRWIETFKEGTWIGTKHLEGGEAKVFFWDESAENYNGGYGVKSLISFAGIIKDGICYTVNQAGQLLGFDGSGFKEVAVFPIYQRDATWSDNSVRRHGMAIIDEKIHILVNSQESNAVNVADLSETFPTGIWEFDKNRGITHKYPINQYDGTESDYGVILNLNGNVGALVATNNAQGKMLVGAGIQNAPFGTNNVLEAILYLDPTDAIPKRGYFITTLFESSGFEDAFQDLLVAFKRLRSSSDKIIIKYRTVKNPNYPIYNDVAATWSDTDTFTTDEDLANAVVGDEVLIINGLGSGTTAHISSISLVGSTYTVNLDETIPNVSGKLAFIINNWRKCATINTQSIERQGFFLDTVGTWIQLKVEMRSASGSTKAGDSPELEKIVVNSLPEAVI